jgi:2-keto-4-pentenoate hydratase/2-oxohepta-3-ene-1,7-dioic acid hydratase in catechol pathway
MILETRVNGEIRQKQDTKELIFDIPTLIETCSMGITLQPGDVIATGTPAGVGLSNGKFLVSGDTVEVSITGLGTLSNVIDKADAPFPACAPLLRDHEISA